MPRLETIIEKGDFKTLLSLVEEDKSVIGKPVSDSTPDQPLHLAVWQNRMKVALFLIEQGADVNTIGDLGKTPLHYASINGCLKLAKVLLEHGANPNIRTTYNHTPMLSAARTGDPKSMKIARLLLESGAEADLNSLVSLGETQRVCALLSQDKNNLWQAVDPFSLLDDAVIMVAYQIMVRKQYEPSPEQDAIVREYEPMFLCLLDAGADINAIASTGVPPLYSAVSTNIPALVRFLLEKGADVNYQYHTGSAVIDLISVSQGSRKNQVRQIMEDFRNKKK